MSIELIALLLISTGVSVVFFIQFRQLRLLRRELDDQLLVNQQIHQRLRLLLDGSSGLGEELRQIEKAMTKPAAHGNASGEVTARQAIELARKGATVDELVDICGLSRGEAELMTTIHQAK